MKKLFIYYSLTGNGDIVADYLKKSNVEIRKVKAIDKMPKSYYGQILTGGFLATINYKAKLIDFNNNVSNYDEIIIGSPIWNDRLSCPINSVLNIINFDGKKVSFILYSGSGKAKNAIKKIKEMYSDANVIILKNPKKFMNELDKIKVIN